MSLSVLSAGPGRIHTPQAPFTSATPGTMSSGGNDAMDIPTSFLMELADVLKNAMTDPNVLKEWVQNEVHQHPYHIAVEIVCVVFIVYMWLQKPFIPDQLPPGEEPTAAEKEELVKSWKTEKVGENFPTPEYHVAGERRPVITRTTGSKVAVEGEGDCDDCGSFNFLRLAAHEKVIDASLAAIEHYGVGACGPRGFYGTVQPHLVLEEQLQRVYDTPAAIIYSFQYATMSSIIPAFAGKNDIVVVDKGVNMSLLGGVDICKAKVFWYDHNDMDMLERILQNVSADTRKPVTRRWIVTEGLFRNYGDLCRLDKIVELRHKYKFRLMVDDSYGVGALGKTGRGVCEHYNLPTSECNVYVGSMDTSYGSVGGFCCGDNMVVDHQRLSSSGYCFSAALPPYTAVACTEAIDIMLAEPQRVTALHMNTEAMRVTFKKHGFEFPPNSDGSPMMLLTYPPSVKRPSRKQQEQNIAAAVEELLTQHKIIVVRPKYSFEDKHAPPAAIRVTSASHYNVKEAEKLAETIAKVALKHMK